MKRLLAYFSIVCICLSLSGCLWLTDGPNTFGVPQWQGCKRHTCPHCQGGHIEKIFGVDYAYRCNDCETIFKDGNR